MATRMSAVENTIIGLQKQITDLRKESSNNETNLENYPDTAENIEEPFVQSQDGPNTAATMASSVARVFPRLIVRETKSVGIREGHDEIPLVPLQMSTEYIGLSDVQSTTDSSTSDDD